MSLVVPDSWIVTSQQTDELTFLSADFQLVIGLKENLLSQGQVLKFFFGEVLLYQCI